MSLDFQVLNYFFFKFLTLFKDAVYFYCLTIIDSIFLCIDSVIGHR